MESLHSAARSHTATGILVDAYRQGRSLDERGEGGATPLHAALRLSPGLLPMSAYLLLSLGASPDLADDRGIRPIHLACALGSEPMIELLLVLKADPDAPDADGRSPRGYLPEKTYTGEPREVLARILDRRPARLSRRGEGLLDTVGRYELLPHAALLLRQGADPNQTSADGLVPLHRCISAAITAALLARGADPNRQTATGITPLHVATRGIGQEITLLLEHGADPDLRDAEGRLPVDGLLAQSYADDFYDGYRLESMRESLINKLHAASRRGGVG